MPSHTKIEKSKQKKGAPVARKAVPKKKMMVKKRK